MNETLKFWIKLILPILSILIIGGIWIGRMDSDIQTLKKKSNLTSIDKEDIESSLVLPIYKIEQNFQAIQKLQESQVATQNQIAITTFILEALEKRVTKGGN